MGKFWSSGDISFPGAAIINRPSEEEVNSLLSPALEPSLKKQMESAFLISKPDLSKAIKTFSPEGPPLESVLIIFSALPYPLAPNSPASETPSGVKKAISAI